MHHIKMNVYHVTSRSTIEKPHGSTGIKLRPPRRKVSQNEEGFAKAGTALGADVRRVEARRLHEEVHGAGVARDNLVVAIGADLEI